jgi:hypothetical protein
VVVEKIGGAGEVAEAADPTEGPPVPGDASAA